MLQNSDTRGEWIVDTHVADLQTSDVICDVDEPPVLDVEHAQGDDDEAVEDDVKLPDVGKVIVGNIQQSSTVFLYAILMKISRVKLIYHSY